MLDAFNINFNRERAKLLADADKQKKEERRRPSWAQKILAVLAVSNHVNARRGFTGKWFRYLLQHFLGLVSIAMMIAGGWVGPAEIPLAPSSWWHGVERKMGYNRDETFLTNPTVVAVGWANASLLVASVASLILLYDAGSKSTVKQD